MLKKFMNIENMKKYRIVGIILITSLTTLLILGIQQISQTPRVIEKQNQNQSSSWERSDFSSFWTNEKTSYPREKYPLVSVVDGDTIKILVNGENTSVRLIGVDTPEKYSTRYGYAECFGEEASQYLKDLLKDISEVEIEYDDSQGTYDKYGRILGYLFVNGENYNQKMIEDGYAREYTYKTPYRYQQTFKKAQKQAELWNVWLRNVNTCNGERKSI